MSIDTNKDLVRAFEAHINARELDEAIALLSPDFVDHTPGVGLPSGIDGVRAFFTMQYTGLPDNHRQSMEMIGEGDKVVHRLSGEGTHKGCCWACRRPAGASRGHASTSGVSKMAGWLNIGWRPTCWV